MNVEVRMATADDLPAVGRLLDQLGYPQTESEVVEACNTPGTSVFVAVFDVNVVGLLALNIRRAFQYVVPIAVIDVLVVDESIRSRGVGNALVSSAVDFAEQHGVGLVELHSNFKREKAHKFYEREGFVATSKYFSKKISR